jgi:hypothetical protein
MPIAESESTGKVSRLTVEQAARLYSTSPTKVRGMLRRGELEAEESGGPEPFVVVHAGRDELTAAQAGRLLGLATPSVRVALRAGRLRGRKDGGRYFVRLDSLLASQRCPAEITRLFGGFTAARLPVPSTRPRVPAARVSVPVYVRLSPQEAEALVLGVERYGSQRAAIGAALAQLGESIPYEAELRRLGDELEERDERLAWARKEAGKAKELAARLPSELWCPGCLTFIPLEQLETEESREYDGGFVWRHRHEGLAALTRGRSTALGRRR